MSKNNKPLSPHLTIYKPQITSLMSISHRFSGSFQYIGNLIIFIYFCAILSGENYQLGLTEATLVIDDDEPEVRLLLG